MSEDNASARLLRLLRDEVRLAAPGAQMSSVRELIVRHRASPVTIQRAVAQLAAEGLLDPRPGRGTFVSVPRPQTVAEAADWSWQTVALGEAPSGGEAMQSLLALPAPDAIPLSSGYLDPALQPLGALGAALARAGRRPSAWERGSVAGREELRAWFAREVGGGLGAEDVVVCPGAQAALATALRALAAPGDPLLVESPTYLGAVAAARAAGLRVVPVPSDEYGVRPDHLAATLARTRARLIYLQPLHANPHAASLAVDRREPVLAAARKAGAFVIEDDWARDLLTTGENPPPPLITEDRDGHVLCIRSLTKASAPGLRVAAILGRGPAIQRLRIARAVDDFYVAGPLQEAALDLVSSPTWRRHLRGLRIALTERRDALLAALAHELPMLPRAAIPGGGLHVWQPLPEHTDDVALAEAAARNGVIIFPGSPFFAAEPSGAYIRLTFAAAPPDLLVEGVRRLARASAAA